MPRVQTDRERLAEYVLHEVSPRETLWICFRHTMGDHAGGKPYCVLCILEKP